MRLPIPYWGMYGATIFFFIEYGLVAKPSILYDYECSFWPPAGIMVVMMIVVRNYNYNNCGAELILLFVTRNYKYDFVWRKTMLWRQIITITFVSNVSENYSC